MPHTAIPRTMPKECPHCSVVCLGGTGLSAHIRGKHGVIKTKKDPVAEDATKTSVISTDNVTALINKCARQVEAWTRLHNSLTESLQSGREALKEV